MNLHQFRQILVITVLLPLILLLLLALVLAWQIQRTLREQRRIDHTDRITAQLNELERLVVDQETGLRGYQLTRDANALEPYQNAEGALHGTLDRLLLLVREDPDQLRRLRQIRDSHELWMGFAGRALDNLRAGKIFGDTGLDLNGAQLMAALRTQIGTMTLIEVKRRDQEVQSTNSQVRTLMTFLLVSSIGVGIVLGIFTQRNMKEVSAAFRTSLEEAHQRADELIENRQWLQTTLDSVGDALIACNQERRVELMNPVARRLTGWSLEDAKGRRLGTVFQTVDEETREPVDEQDGITAKGHSLLLAKDGAEYLIDQSAAPIRDAKGAVAGVVLVFRDVTDLRKRELALMATEKLAVAGRLSASIAHEIHNPLDSVANLHYLMEKESDPALTQRYLAMAQQELNRTLQISRAMLGLYREPKAPVEVNLRDLLQSVLLLLDRQLKDQSVTVERKLNEDASIQGFPGELRQVFTNLITNGAEAAGPGGRVQVLLEDSHLADSRPGATVTITDSGRGILESHLNKIFKPFFTTKGELGTGLGLWVSRGIVEKHGGTIELTNSTDPAFPGAAVRVCLPALGPASVMAPRPTTVGNHHPTDVLPENGDARSQRSNDPRGHKELV
ncbi:MAG: CHASE3 domain-containing protein [Acidobacteriaceae bacterium]